MSPAPVPWGPPSIIHHNLAEYWISDFVESTPHSANESAWRKSNDQKFNNCNYLLKQIRPPTCPPSSVEMAAEGASERVCNTQVQKHDTWMQGNSLIYRYMMYMYIYMKSSRYLALFLTTMFWIFEDYSASICQGTVHNIDCHWKMQTWHSGLFWQFVPKVVLAVFSSWIRGPCRWGIWNRVMIGTHLPQYLWKACFFLCIASGFIHSKVWFPRQSVEAPIRLYRSYGEWFEAGLQADLAFVWLFLKNGFGIFLFVSFSELSQVTSCFCRLLCPTSLLRRLRPELMNAGECSKGTTTSWCGPYIAVVLRARTQLLTYAHCWGLASGLTGRVLQKCTQQLTRRTSAQLEGKDNQSDPTQISLFERGRRQGIPETETNCHRYKLDDRTVTRVKSPAQSFLKSSLSSPNKKHVSQLWGPTSHPGKLHCLTSERIEQEPHVGATQATHA